ncbi:hypothetical protein B481_1980 [Planococcus halocryophilus Or1]|nr:hypothetical protein B481_1980 [Planococcus halocryophilus Or1]
MMLTEHVDLIRAWYDEDKYDAKPELDEYDLQLLQKELILAAQRKCQVKMESWKDKKFHYHIGIIQELNAHRNLIVYEDPAGMHRLSMNELTALQMID